MDNVLFLQTFKIVFKWKRSKSTWFFCKT